jgi:TonB family protein
MATATVALGARRRTAPGPALDRSRFPLLPLALSAGAHGALILGLVAAATIWQASKPKAYVVNLVPAVPAIGAPQSRPAPPAPPAPRPRTPEPPPPPAAKVPDLPARPQPPAPPDLPTRPAPPPRDMPARDMPARDMPVRDPVLPERAVAVRPPSMRRPGDKELPSLSRPELPRPRPVAVPPPAVPAPAQTVARSEPPPAGRPVGSPQGSGTLAVSAQGDFPFTWYLQRVDAKIREKWAAPPGSYDGQFALVVFEIGPDGQIGKPSIEKTSGNTAYDFAVLRAVIEASPFPPLPVEFKDPPLRVHLNLNYSKRG